MGGGVVIGAKFSWEGGLVLPFPKLVLNLHRTNEKLHCKVEPIGSAVSEILWYKKTDIIVHLYK